MTQIESSSDWVKITQALSGSLTPDEYAEFEAWVEESSERKKILAELVTFWNNSAKPHRVDANEQLEQTQRLLSSIREPVSTPARPRKNMDSHRSRRWLVGSLSVASILLAVGVFWQTYSDSMNLGSDGSSEYKMYTTRPGQWASIKLADGTQVHMNVGSVLEVPRDFGAGSRSVRLTGQAAFNVTQKSGTPFVVAAPGAQVTVLGTEFVVRGYTPDVKVTVKSGRVSVGICTSNGRETRPTSMCPALKNMTTLSPNESASVDPEGNVLATHDADLEAEMAFTSGRLLLGSRPLVDLIPDLNRWYDADIRLSDDTLDSFVLGGWVSVGSLDDFIQYLVGALPVKVERTERRIVVSPLHDSSISRRGTHGS